MAAIGGSIESITVAGRYFAVAADAESNRKIGGFENEVASNGDGTAREIKTRVPLSLDGLTLVIDDDKGDGEYLQDQADSIGFKPLGITYASGVTYTGSAKIVGELSISSMNATAAVSFAGPGKLARL